MTTYYIGADVLIKRFFGHFFVHFELFRGKKPRKSA